MTKIVIDDELGFSRLHVEIFDYLNKVMLAIEPNSNIETNEVWLTKIKLRKLLDSLTDIYNEM